MNIGQIEAKAWNDKYPIGSKVIIPKRCGLDICNINTTTTSEAWSHNGIAVVRLESEIVPTNLDVIRHIIK